MKNGRFKFLSDCAREILTAGIVHAIFLIFGWFRIVKLWDEPKIPNGILQGFWFNKNVRWYLRIFTILKFLCLFLCTAFVGTLHKKTLIIIFIVVFILMVLITNYHLLSLTIQN